MPLARRDMSALCATKFAPWASEVYCVSEVIPGIVKFCLPAKWANLTSLVRSANFTDAGYVGVLCSLYGREEV